MSKLTWEAPAGSPIHGKIYHRESFARSLGISIDMIVTIPAIVGNDSIGNLVEETTLKNIIRDNPRYRGGDTEKTIHFLMRQRTMLALERSLQMVDVSMAVIRMFRENLAKAREMYESEQWFNEVEFKRVSSFGSGRYPDWMISQYKDCKLSNKIFEILLRNRYFFRVIPDDYRYLSARILSCPIRQDIYGMLEVRDNVAEVVREGGQLVFQSVAPRQSDLHVSIYKMHLVTLEVRVHKLCSVLLCDPGTLASLDAEWYVAIASVCYWAKSIGITRYDFRLKALLLCFAECFNREPTTFDPVFTIENLHTLIQWQCVYYDAIMLDQVLALPLPYLSPALLFDGKRVCCYFQLGDWIIDFRLARVPESIRRLYEALYNAVCMNIAS